LNGGIFQVITISDAGEITLRIAIAIGVNKPRSPAPLQGAVPDAVAFAKWAGRQGFDEIKSFTDAAGPVRFADIFAEVERVVEARTYSQIVIYFAGHGFRIAGSEVWLLSGAPNNPSEAISVEASMSAARESGLTNVVFISDACRSIPNGLQSSNVDGGSIFPNTTLNRGTRPEIDRLFATLPSLVAVEAALANDKARREGIFTREFMNSYRDTPREFVETIQENGRPIEVVTNRKLKKLLPNLVEEVAFSEAAQSGQLPDFIVESVDAYVGRVERSEAVGRMRPSILVEIGPEISPEASVRRGPPRRPPNVVRGPAPPSVASVAQMVIQAASAPLGNVEAATAAARGIDRVGFEDSINLFSQQVPVERFETQTGFSVTGAGVKSAVCPNFQAECIEGQFVRLWPRDVDAPSASVLIEFDDGKNGEGNGIVLPGLRGYIGHVFVDQGAVINVNYVPATNSKFWGSYLPQRPQIEALRASVATAAGLGVFRIAPDEAQSFADKIRQFKAFDPTLGLYAAYAYASAGVDREVASILRYMRDDLKTVLFDVAMLAERGVGPRETGPQTILPFCPMLRQGWSLLGVRDARLPGAVREARNWLLPALWTTFAPQGVTILKDAIARGDFR
jgi:hypothetical protein